MARNVVEQTQTHRGRSMSTRSERCFGRNDNRTGVSAPSRRHSAFFWRRQNYEARTDAQRFGSSSPCEMLEPVSAQSLDPAAKFTDEDARIMFRFAADFERHALRSRTFDDCEGASEALR
jgi:hypothetical protein